MLNFNSFRLTAAVLACFLVSVFISLRLSSPSTTTQLMEFALGFVGMLALKSLATAMLIRVLSGKSVSLPCALTISLTAHFVNQVSSDLYIALT